MMSNDFEIEQLGQYLGDSNSFQTHISPVEAPCDWLCANINYIRSTLEGIPALLKDDIGGWEKLIYPRLFTYTLAYLRLHADPNVLSDFTASTSQWVQFDEITSLQHHRSIKDTLFAFRTRSRTQYRNESLDPCIINIARLDVLSIATRILAIVDNDQRKRLLLDLQGPQAQSLLDLLQEILDAADLDTIRPPILRILLELSKRSGLYPASLILQGVQPQGEESVAAGSYGEIWEGISDGAAVAIKVMRINHSQTKKEKVIKLFCKEAIVWRQLRHPHVLPFCGVYQWPGASFRPCLVSPWMKNGNVVQYLERTSDADRRSLILGVARGLEYLHTFDPPVIHGDLRGVNILVTLDERACIADFGLCTFAYDSLSQFTLTSGAFQVTNMLWLAPELLQYESGKEPPRQSLATDIYALGCVCYEIFAGYPRFLEFNAPYKVITAVAGDRRPSRPANKTLDNAIWELMNRCWAKVIASRPKASDIVQSLLFDTTDQQPPADDSAFSLQPVMSNKPATVHDIIIALVGPTGSGKSNFINVITEQSSVAVGHDLVSCTQDVQAVTYPHPDGSGRNIIFVDTPGFDTAERTDSQVLELIAAWMEEFYTEHTRLTGLLVFQPITDVRMRGTLLKNLTMVESLCGKEAALILTTTMWDEVRPATGDTRERQLRDEFWAPIMGEGCRIARFANNVASAWHIINLFDISIAHAPLVQSEIVDGLRGEIDAAAASVFRAEVTPSSRDRNNWEEEGPLQENDTDTQDGKNSDIVIRAIPVQQDMVDEHRFPIALPIIVQDAQYTSIGGNADISRAELGQEKKIDGREKFNATSHPSVAPKPRRRRNWKGKGLLQKDDVIMQDARDTDIVILVMGPSGAGKSTFINAVIGNNMASVGHDLKSCTAAMEHFIIAHPRDPMCRLVFVDTPGFDHTYTDDTEIVRRIAVWLAKSYSDGMKLAGVVYLQEISQPRMMGAPRKNLEMFRELCGDKALRNVVLATTKWGDVDREAGNRREKQLREKYWEHMLKLGSTMMPFHVNHESAWKIINHILDNPPVGALLIQEQLVDLRMTLPELAGQKLRATFKELLAAQEKVAEKLQASSDIQGDGRLRQTFEENQRRIQSIIHQIQELKVPPARRLLSFMRR